MKKIIKKTPITLGGSDVYEILIEDDSIINCTCCDLCLYRGSISFDLELMASCIDVHGCSMNPNRYFISEPILTE